METNDKKLDIPPFVKTGRTLLENDITEIPMLWGHLLQKYGIAVLGGHPNSHKELSDCLACKYPRFEAPGNLQH